MTQEKLPHRKELCLQSDDTKLVSFFFSSVGLGSKIRCLHSAPVRAVRGPPDLVRRLALVKTRISVFMVHKI